MFDVIIVGAGPAGASAAYYLAKSGAKVLLLEKEKLPRFKPCGGGTSLKFFSSLPFDASKAIKGKVSKVCYFLNMRDSFEVELGIQMVMLNRREFDYLIVQEAARFEAEVIDQVRITDLWIEDDKVRVKTGRGEFEGKYLIGADGVHSYVGRRTGLTKRRNWYAIEAEVPGLKHNPDTAFFGFGQIKEGYAWSFPKSDYFSVGIGGKGDREPVAKLMRWLEFLGYKGNRKETRICSHPLPEAVPGEKLQTENVLLIGDAAGLVDPFTGEGIRFAIHSAEIACSSILSGDLTQYSRAIYEQISSDFRYAFRFKWLFFRFTELCYRFGVKNKRVSNEIARILTGDSSYRELYGRVVKTALNPFAIAKAIRK